MVGESRELTVVFVRRYRISLECGVNLICLSTEGGLRKRSQKVMHRLFTFPEHMWRPGSMKGRGGARAAHGSLVWMLQRRREQLGSGGATLTPSRALRPWGFGFFSPLDLLHYSALTLTSKFPLWELC